MSVATAIALLIFCGAAGKSGQVPLHVWLPDAMEGPTPVSALIHAATMVAAGVFLVARVFPLMGAAAGVDAAAAGSAALSVVTWVGAITAVFAAMIAVAQYDIKRILAYSTVSQLGFMFLGLGTGGVAVGMFHLITHAFFKALLFLGAGSVIHGCHGEQDIRRMGGLRSRMPVTFLTYAVGMMSLAGVPLIAGFWSKDEILHSAWGWGGSRIPFLMGCFAALLTAFYMTRQMCLVFFGTYRGDQRNARMGETGGKAEAPHESPHESPREMTLPLVVLAAGAVIVGFLGTPFWPGFQRFLGEGTHDIHWGSTLLMMGVSALLAAAGIGAGYWWYGLETRERAEDPDPIEVWRPALFRTLAVAFRVDEFYALSIGRLTSWLAWVSDWLDRWVWSGAVRAVSVVTLAVAWVNRVVDEQVINGGFDAACGGLRGSGRRASRMQTGQVQTYLRILGLGLVVLMLVMAWGCEAS
jgi:NADH-quinone oxidoreductase subunit L